MPSKKKVIKINKRKTSSKKTFGKTKKNCGRFAYKKRYIFFLFEHRRHYSNPMHINCQLNMHTCINCCFWENVRDFTKNGKKTVPDRI